MAYILERVVDGAYMVRDTTDGVTEPIFDAQVRQLINSGITIRGLSLDDWGDVIVVDKVRSANMAEAKRKKDDEYYTQMEDIRIEFNNYDPKVFEDKVIYCPCDAPMDWAVTRQSQFVRFFMEMAHIYKYKKLIVTCLHSRAGEEDEDSGKVINRYMIERRVVERDSYRIANSKAPIGEEYVDGRYCYIYQDGHTEPIPVDVMNEAVVGKDGNREFVPEHFPKYYTYAVVNKGTCKPDARYESGDFRSEECRGYMQECDIVITNPPFSIFRSLVAQIVEFNKDFILIGNTNAIVFKEFFPLLYTGKVHLGANISTTDILKPGLDEYTSTDKEVELKYQGKKIPKKCRPDEDYLFKGSNRLKMHFFRGDGKLVEIVADWFTTLPIRTKQVHDKSYYKSMAFLLDSGVEFPEYDNYDAIEVGKEANIPIDYDGVMGVPVTSLIWLDTENLWEIVDANDVLKVEGHSPTGLIKSPDPLIIDNSGHTHTLSENCAQEKDSQERVISTLPVSEAASLHKTIHTQEQQAVVKQHTLMAKNVRQDVPAPAPGAGAYVCYVNGSRVFSRLFIRRR